MDRRQRCIRAIHRTLESPGRRPVCRVARGAARAALARCWMRYGRSEPGDPETIRAGLAHWRRSSGVVHRTRRCGADGSPCVVPAGIGGQHWAGGRSGRRRGRGSGPELRSRRRSGPSRMAASPRTGRRGRCLCLGLRPWHGNDSPVLGRGRGRRSRRSRAGSGWAAGRRCCRAARGRRSSRRVRGRRGTFDRDPTVFADFDDLWLPFLGGTGGAPGYVATLDDAHRDAIQRERNPEQPAPVVARLTTSFEALLELAVKG